MPNKNKVSIPTWNSSAGRPESIQRRSQRVIVSVPITVCNEGGPKFEEEARTLIVNAHGALIALAANVVDGQILLLRNQLTRTEQASTVKYIGAAVEDKTQIGVEFNSPAPLFWGIQFPPEDWPTQPSAPALRPAKSE